MFLYSVLIILLLINCTETNATIPCNYTSACEALLWLGSKCIEGTCSNPFESGCLRSLLGADKFKKRTCNSDDPRGAAAAGICEAPDEILDYMEIRIMVQNWESSVLEAWLLQIVLSELLGVPVTIETGSADAKVNFYDPQNSFSYQNAKPNNFDAIRNASAAYGGDCRNVVNNHACAHVIPETWSSQRKIIRQLVADDVIELPESLGVNSLVGWFIPKFVAEKESTLLSFLGMTGEANRLKLAKLFNRPTTWKDYCDLVSSNNCTMDDGVAKRYPRDKVENEKMFADSLYKGYFRATEKNNCTSNPYNCTGHIADLPCDWTSYLQPQAYYNDIYIDTNNRNYSHSQLTEMWQAANSTKSNIIQYTHTHSLVYRQFLGTQSEFLKVLFPPPSQECIDSRINMTDRCSVTANLEENFFEFQHSGCDNEIESLQKIIVSHLYKRTYRVPEAHRSPAYNVIKSFTVSDLQIGQIFDYWLERKSFNTPDYDSRYAACRWAAENVDVLQSFIPETYPRVIRNENKYSTPFSYAVKVLGSSATLLVVVAIAVTYLKRTKIFQVEIPFLLLAGALFISVASLILAIEPSHIKCMLTPWFLAIGYTLELVPLIVKVSAMNRITRNGSKLESNYEHVKVSRENLFGTAFFLIFVLIIFLFLMTLADPPLRVTDLELTTENVDGFIVVNNVSHCRSKRPAWRYISFIWICLLLISATVLAFQNRKMQYRYNEAQVTAIVIYSHFFFIMVYMITFLLENSLSISRVTGFRSMVLSLDTMSTIMLYFMPKIIFKNDLDEFSSKNSPNSSPGINRDNTSPINTCENSFPSSRSQIRIRDNRNSSSPINSLSSEGFDDDAQCTKETSVIKSSIDELRCMDGDGSRDSFENDYDDHQQQESKSYYRTIDEAAKDDYDSRVRKYKQQGSMGSEEETTHWDNTEHTASSPTNLIKSQIAPTDFQMNSFQVNALPALPVIWGNENQPPHYAKQMTVSDYDEKKDDVGGPMKPLPVFPGLYNKDNRGAIAGEAFTRIRCFSDEKVRYLSSGDALSLLRGSKDENNTQLQRTEKSSAVVDEEKVDLTDCNEQDTEKSSAVAVDEEKVDLTDCNEQNTEKSNAVAVDEENVDLTDCNEQDTEKSNAVAVGEEKVDLTDFNEQNTEKSNAVAVDEEKVDLTDCNENVEAVDPRKGVAEEKRDVVSRMIVFFEQNGDAGSDKDDFASCDEMEEFADENDDSGNPPDYMYFS